MRVRSQFSHHYERPDDGEVDGALVNATVVLDTNVLLGLYRASPDLRTKRLEVFKTIGERLFLPYQVGVEFHRNRPVVAAGISDAYAALRTATTTLHKAVKSFGGDGRYDETSAAVRALVDPLLGQIVDGLAALEEDDPHRIDLADDPILNQLEALLEGHVGQPPRAKNLAARVRDFTSIRVPLRLPPGYDDAHKAAASGAAAAAGDYLLWCEVLAHARKHETDVVLVTDDAKGDWWQAGGAGMPTVPHPLLVSEFRRETGHEYYQLDSRELLKRAPALDISVSTENLEEEDELARATAEAESIVERIAAFQGHGMLSATATPVESELGRLARAGWRADPGERERLEESGRLWWGAREGLLGSRLVSSLLTAGAGERAALSALEEARRRDDLASSLVGDGQSRGAFATIEAARRGMAGLSTYEVERIMQASKDWTSSQGRERLDQAARDIERVTDELDADQRHLPQS